MDWDRARDTVGAGLACLDGGDEGISRGHVAEIYCRWVFNDHLALTADAQYMYELSEHAGSTEGRVMGLRSTLEFQGTQDRAVESRAGCVSEMMPARRVGNLGHCLPCAQHINLLNRLLLEI